MPQSATGSEPTRDDPADNQTSNPPGDAPTPAPHRRKAVAAWVVTVLAVLLVWFALTAPNELGGSTPRAFARIPLEGLLIVALLLVLPRRARRPFAWVVGVVLGLFSIVKILDIAFFAALGRAFNPVADGSYFKPAVSLLRDSIGKPGAIVSTVVALALVIAFVVLMPLSLLRIDQVVHRHRVATIRGLVALGLAWVLFAALGVHVAPGSPVASTSAARLAYERASEVRAGIADQKAFAKAVVNDPLRDTAPDTLLTGLRGKDVLVVFVESYGRVAVQDPQVSPGVNAVLDAGTDRLEAAGFSARSSFLHSPTFGGISWLAHSTLQSGLWVDNQRRYDDLVASDRFTLSQAFKGAGWRTVADIPSNRDDWPQGTSFYHYDKIYDARNVGYAGPAFSYASMPDQYVLSAFQRLELAKRDRPPVMAELDLVSSHGPWVPLPRMVDWDKVGDGSIFDDMPAQGLQPNDIFRDSDQVRAAYGRSIQYTMNSLFSWLETFHEHDKNLVLVVLGDHQPAPVVSGENASRDVPISIISGDPKVLDRISTWGWHDGMRPEPNAPVLPMDSFRDRFLTAYGPH
jgi:hypothetical protein